MLREYAGEAYELELNSEMKKLAERFTEWERGDISAGQLSEFIHKFYRGPSKDLYNKYNQGDNALNVAHAVVTGLIDTDKMPEELLEALAGPISFYQNMAEYDE